MLASIETDKAVVDFEMQEEGYVAKLLFDYRDVALKPLSHHERWLRSAKIAEGDRSAHEHEVLTQIMEDFVILLL